MIGAGMPAPESSSLAVLLAVLLQFSLLRSSGELAFEHDAGVAIDMIGMAAAAGLSPRPRFTPPRPPRPQVNAMDSDLR